MRNNNPIWDDISRQRSVSDIFPLAVKSWDPKSKEMSCLMATQRIVDKYCQFLYQDSGEAADHDNSKASPITPVGPRRLARQKIQARQMSAMIQCLHMQVKHSNWVYSSWNS